MDQISGFSPLHAKELMYRFQNSTDRVEIYKAFMQEFEHGGSTKQIVEVNGKILLFTKCINPFRRRQI